MDTKPNVLITGIAGFIGSHLAEECLNLGFNVFGIDDLSGGYLENIPENVRFVRGSLTDHILVEEIFSQHKFDYVYHLAAYAAEGLSHFIRRFNYKNNLVGSVNLINAAVKNDVKCFVFTSSIAVYGQNQLPMTEAIVPVPEDPYGISKYAVELDLEAARKMFGLNYVIFRPHNVFGERQNIADKYRNVIGIFMNQALKGLPMTIFGDGSQTRAFSYVGDIISTMARSVLLPSCYGEIFNIGADQPYTILDLAEAVSLCLNTEPNIINLPARKEVKHAYASHDKLERYFGKQPKTDLRDGLNAMAAWIKKVGAKDSTPFQGIEIYKHLPSSWVSIVM
jgi:UDP-glucose 4-epimerase